MAAKIDFAPKSIFYSLQSLCSKPFLTRLTVSDSTGAIIVPDAVSPVPDAASPVPDAASPVPDAVSSVPDAVSPVPDAVSSVPDAVSFATDAVSSVPEDTSLGPRVSPADFFTSPENRIPRYKTDIFEFLGGIPQSRCEAVYWD